MTGTHRTAAAATLAAALALPGAAHACDADRASSMVGRPIEASSVANLKSRTDAASVRVIMFTAPVVMDRQDSRLNILVDGLGRIERVTCG